MTNYYFWELVALTIFLLIVSPVVHSLLVGFSVRNTIELFGLYGWGISLFVALASIAMLGLYFYWVCLVVKSGIFDKREG